MSEVIRHTKAYPDEFEYGFQFDLLILYLWHHVDFAVSLNTMDNMQFMSFIAWN